MDVLAHLADAEVGGYGIDARRAPWGDWPTLAALAAAPEPVLGKIAEQARTDHPGVSSGWMVENLGWHFGVLVAAGLALDGGTPPLDPETVQVLPGAGGLAQAIAVPDIGWETATPASGLAQLERVLDPLVDALVARRLRPRAALWRQAGDQVAGAFAWVADAGLGSRALRHGEALLALDSPLSVPPRYGETPRWRASCCLGWRSPGAPLCAGCPRQPGFTKAV